MAECRFERLDRGQGVLLELLFTGDSETFKVDGVFDGAPRGIAPRGVLDLKELIDFKAARRHLIHEPPFIFFWLVLAPVLVSLIAVVRLLAALFTGEFLASARLLALFAGSLAAAGLLGFIIISLGALLRTRDFRLILRPGHRVPAPLRAIRLSEITHPRATTPTSAVGLITSAVPIGEVPNLPSNEVTT
jgi:hypothetical protein